MTVVAGMLAGCHAAWDEGCMVYGSVGQVWRFAHCLALEASSQTVSLGACFLKDFAKGSGKTSGLERSLKVWTFQLLRNLCAKQLACLLQKNSLAQVPRTLQSENIESVLALGRAAGDWHSIN